MAMSKQARAKRIRKACARSAAGDYSQASVGMGRVSLSKPTARAKAPATMWGNGLNRPRINGRFV